MHILSRLVLIVSAWDEEEESDGGDDEDFEIGQPKTVEPVKEEPADEQPRQDHKDDDFQKDSYEPDSYKKQHHNREDRDGGQYRDNYRDRGDRQGGYNNNRRNKYDKYGGGDRDHDEEGGHNNRGYRQQRGHWNEDGGQEGGYQKRNNKYQRDRPPRDHQHERFDQSEIDPNSNYRQYYCNDPEFFMKVMSQEATPFNFKMHAFPNSKYRGGEAMDEQKVRVDSEMAIGKILDQFNAKDIRHLKAGGRDERGEKTRINFTIED